jgi:hypothetical protein
MSYTMSYTTSYVFLTTSYVQRTISPKNVRCRTFFTGSCHFDVRHRMRHRTFFDDVAYDVVRHHRYYTISYVRFRCRWLTSPKTYDIALRRRIQYRSIRYAFRSIRYACLGRRQARRDVLAMPLQLPLVLLPDPRPCRMVCIAQAQCRSPFPQSGTGRCCQCEW